DHVQGDGLAGGQRHRAQARGDPALVADVFAQQHNVAAIGVDLALIEDVRSAVAGKVVFTAHEVGVTDIQGRVHQTVDVYRSALSEHNAIRVDQKHLAVGRKATKNARRIGTQYAVEGHRAAVRLYKLDGFTVADIEALPVQRH